MNDSQTYVMPTTIQGVLDVMKNFVTEDSLKNSAAYKPDPTDIFIATAPKCGTTWMQQIVHGLRTRGSMDFEEISGVVPWIDLAQDMDIDIRAPQVAKPKAFKTHSTLKQVPQGGKYIEIFRDPKDTLLSHYKFFEDFFFQKDSISIEIFAREYFIPRKSIINHILDFWDRRKDEDVLSFCFEDMKADLPGTVERVADFIGVPLDNKLRDIVVRQSDIKFMLEHKEKFDENLLRKAKHHVWKIPYSENAFKVRNGRVGESVQSVPDEIKQEVDELWEKEVASTIGLKSYIDLRKAISNIN